MPEVEPQASPEESASVPPRFWRRVLGRFVRHPLAILLGVTAALLPWAGLLWLVETPEGLHAIARGLTTLGRGDLHVEGARGRLRDRFSIGRLDLQIGATRVELRDLEVAWKPGELIRGIVHCESLAARSLVIGQKSSGNPPSVPKSFALPLELRLDAVRLGRFDFHTDFDTGPGPRRFGFSALSGRAILARHRWQIASLSGRSDWGPASLKGSLQPDPPFALSAAGRIDAHYGAHNLPAMVRARGSLVALSLSAEAAADQFKASAKAQIRSFDGQALVGGELEVSELDPQRLSASAPHALLALQVHLAPLPPRKGVPEAVTRSGFRIGGPLRITNARPQTLDAGGVPLERFSSELSWDGGRVEFKEAELHLSGGGKLSGSLAWQRQSPGDALGLIDANLALAGVDPSRLLRGLPRASLAGRISAEGGRERQEAALELVDKRLSLEAKLLRRGSRLELSGLRLASGNAEIRGSGLVALDTSRSFEFALNALRFDPHAFWAASPSGLLSGGFTVQGRLAPRLALEGNFKLTDSRLAGFPLTGEGDVSLADGHLRHARLSLDALGNRIRAAGAFGRAGEQLQFVIDAPELGRLGAGFGGRLRGRASIAGSLDQLSGTLELLGEKLAAPGGHRLDAINLRARLPEGRNAPFLLQLAVAGFRAPGASEASLRRASLSAEGSRGDHTFTLEVELAHRYAVHAEARGGLSQGLEWSGKLNSLSVEAGGELQLASPAALDFGPDHIRLGAARLRGEKADVKSEILSWSPHEILARGRLSGAQIHPGLSDPLRVRTHRSALLFGAEWNVQLREHANGLVHVFREGGDLVVGEETPVALGISELEIIAAATDDRLALSVNAVGRRSGRLSASVTAEAQRSGGRWHLAPNQPLLGRAQIAIPNVDWLGPLVDANLRTVGGFSGDFSFSGTPAAPVASGSIQGEKLGLVMVDQGLRLAGGKLRMRFDADRVYLDELSFVSPNRVRPDEGRIDYKALTAEPGKASAKGKIELASGLGVFQLEADRLPILQRHNRWLLISGQGQVASTWKSMTLTGRFAVPAGYIGFARKGPPSLDDDVVVRGRAQPGEQRFRIATDLEIDLGRDLYLKAFGVDTRLLGALSLHARPGEALRASGSIETRDGLYDAYGQRLTIDEGKITFLGPLGNPAINVTALRKGLSVEAGVQISGTVQRPRVKLVSSPNVPDVEKMSWIMLGRAPGIGSEADGALMMAAASVLLGDTTGGITSQIAHTFGIDQIRLAQSEAKGLWRATTSQVAGSATGFATSSASSGGGDTVSQQVVVIGKRLSNDLYLSLEQGVLGTESIVKLSYALTRRVALVARAGTEQALDLNYTISFR